MGRLQNLSGQKHGRWTVVDRVPNTRGKALWNCVCECGSKSIVAGYDLLKGISKSCGCLKIELQSLPEGKAAENRKLAAKVKQRDPKRREQKRQAQMRYVVSDKAVLAFFHRWARKRKNVIKITDEEYLQFRLKPCSKCCRGIEGLGACFTLVKPRAAIETSNMIPMCGICKLIGPKEKFDPIRTSMNLLRRAWKKTPMASIAKQKARSDRGRYQCAHCKGLFREKDTQLDHVSPVIEVDKGFVNLDTFARRLLCDDSNLQVLCKPCHQTKTLAENSKRARKA